jgi:quercetin dioxygenase-like cupin family protein
MTTTASAAPIIRAAEDGDRRWFFGGGVHIWKATAEETDGAFLLVEMISERGKVTPLHAHPDSDETMIVLEGEITMHLDGQDHRVGSGGVAVAPRGVPHAFMVTSEVARLLCLHTPGCCQAFYFAASEPTTTSDEPGLVDFDRIRAAAAQHGGIEILGPPPFGRPA